VIDICTRAKYNKNKSFKSHIPVVVFWGNKRRKEFFYSRKHTQTIVAGVDFHCRKDCVMPPFRKEYGSVQFFLFTKAGSFCRRAAAFRQWQDAFDAEQ
jgi:hypothetical protein